ncbi:MAG: hypothetical protein H0T45_02225 [Pyrinomonadaceae bacterium]|nr:hypothetical protein [Pyrinomonadaceae bacterium]
MPAIREIVRRRREMSGEALLCSNKSGPLYRLDRSGADGGCGAPSLTAFVY